MTNIILSVKDYPHAVTGPRVIAFLGMAMHMVYMLHIMTHIIAMLKR